MMLKTRPAKSTILLRADRSEVALDVSLLKRAIEYIKSSFGSLSQQESCSDSPATGMISLK